MNKITRYLLLIGLVLVAACAPIFGGASAPKAKLSAMPQLRGVNFPGAEMLWGEGNTASPVSGTDYLFVSHQDIDYVSGKKANFARLLFSWEALQPTPNAPFPTTGNSGAYVSAFVDRVNYATSKGMYVMIEPHGASTEAFAKYKGNFIGSSAVPNSQFADLWSRLATQFKDNPKVVFGLMNEPNGMSTVQWFNGAQAAVLAIRATGATNLIMVEGNGWSGAESWTSDWYDTATPKVSNATAWKTINDPIGNTALEVHSYFDANAGGGANDIVSPTIGVERLKVTVDWARAHGVKVHLSEFGANVNAANAQVAVTNLLKYIDANQDVVIGWAWWAYGPPAWWSGYTFTLDPKSNYTVDDPKMAWLTPYFVGSVAPAPTPTTTSTTPTPPPSGSKPTSPIAFTKDKVFTLTTNGVTSWAYVPPSYDSTHNTPTELFVWLHGCGGQSEFDVSMVSYMPNQGWISLAVGGREKACWSNLATDGPKILAAIADIKTHFNVDPKRVVLGGYSSGGDIGYPLVFANASLFSGALFENTGPSSAALTASKTAAWKLNIAHLAHTGDTTYPIANVRTNMATLRANGFPVTLIEKAGTHYDNDSGATGTQYDLRTFLLPYLNAGWVAGSSPAPTCTFAYSAWSECQPSGSQTRTATSSPAGCAGTPTLSQACTYVPPACAYTYTLWGDCQPNGTQTRSVASTTPTPCTAGVPVESQACVYTSPTPTDTDGDGVLDSVDKCPTVKGVKMSTVSSNGCLPLVVTAVKTYDWGTGYCKQYYFKNNNPVAVPWKKMTIHLNDGKLRGKDSVWGATFPNPTATGTVVVTPLNNNVGVGTIAAKANSATVGFCADYGPTKYVGTSGGLTY